METDPYYNTITKHPILPAMSAMVQYKNGVFNKKNDYDIPDFDYDQNFVYSEGKSPIHLNRQKHQNKQSSQNYKNNQLKKPNPIKLKQIANSSDSQDEKYQKSIHFRKDPDFDELLNKLNDKDIGDDFMNQSIQLRSEISDFQPQMDIPNQSIILRTGEDTHNSISSMVKQLPLAAVTKIFLRVRLDGIKKVRVKRIVFKINCSQSQCGNNHRLSMKRNTKNNKFDEQASQSALCFQCSTSGIKIMNYSLQDSQTIQLARHDEIGNIEIDSIQFSKLCSGDGSKSCFKKYTDASQNMIVYGAQKTKSGFCDQCDQFQQIQMKIWSQVQN